MENRSLKGWWNEFQFSNRAYIVPSVLGLILILITIGIFGLGTFHHNSVLSFLSFLLSIFFIVGMIQSNQNLADLLIENLSMPPTAAHTETTVHLGLQNSGKDSSYLIRGNLEQLKAHSPEFEEIPAQSLAPLTFRIRAPKRGIYPHPSARIHSAFPVGLFYTWRRKKFEGQWIVYPEPAGNPRLPSQKEELDDDFQGHRKKLQGESDTRVDWKAHARGHPGLVKEFESSTVEHESLQWDDLDESDVERKLSQMALWVLTAHQLGKTYSLQLPKQKIDSGSGDAHFRNSMRMLAQYPS